jgi:hypothetical protein
MHEQNQRTVYAVEALLLSDEKTRRLYSGYHFHFDDDDFGSLWRDLNDQSKQTIIGRKEPRSPNNIVRTKDLPQLSRLVPRDDVPFIYSAEAVQALREECQRAMPRLHDQKAQRLLQSLVTTADVAIQGSGELVIYRFGSSDTPQPRLQSIYTIETRILSGDEVMSLFTVQFEPDALAEFWNNLGVTRIQWQEWDASLTTKYVPIVEDFPQLSGLASVDEGTIKYKGNAISELWSECRRARQLTQTAADEKLLDDLINACSLAMQNNGQVVVHPFGRR